MGVSMGRQHSAFRETHWRTFSRWLGLDVGAG